MPSSAGPILEIRRLNVTFLDPHKTGRKIEAVRDLSLSLEPGSFTSIVGESGSGKSVTSLSVTRLLRAYSLSGSILWHTPHGKKDLLALEEKELAKIRGKEIAYVFQDPASCLNPVLRVGRQISEVFLAHCGADAAAAKKAVYDLLSAVQMKDVERVYRSYPHELSGGMRQRAMIAMALIAGPRLLIADEPTSALDSDVEKEILELLLKIKKEKNLTLLFITHDMAHAANFSDKIYVMRQGRLLETLQKEGSSFTPKENYTRKLFSVSLWNVPAKSILEDVP